MSSPQDIYHSYRVITPVSTDAQRKTVDDIVRNQIYYSNICEEQSAVFREHVEEFTKEYDRYMQSEEVAKPGQNWKPSLGDRDAYIQEMARRCTVVPSSIADRVRIYCAAHAILTSTVFVDMAQLPKHLRPEVLAEANTQSQADSTAALPFDVQHAEPLVEQPLTRPDPLPPTRFVTTEDCMAFKSNPTLLVNKQFLLETESDNVGLYEILEVCYLRGQWTCDVLLEGCIDPEEVPLCDVVEMVAGSSLLEV